MRGIADSHGAAIEFEAKRTGGVVVSVLFDKLEEDRIGEGRTAEGRNGPDGDKD